jgi:hypothetical protein
MDERIEAAARAHDPELFVHPLHEPGQCEYCDEERAHARKHIREIIAAAFPELSGDKPTHWLAPMEPADEMIRAGRREAAFVNSDAASIYRAMGAAARGERTEAADAYLGKGGGG